MQKIPFHIVSGFLGSGKTTFLKRIIEKHSGEYKLGIIQNEYAPSDLDGLELNSTGNAFHLLRINQGSVFCVCLLGDFSRSLERFIDEYHPDVVILEASGLSDTTSVAEIISGGNLAQKIYLATNWCVVDCLNFSRAGLMKQRMIHQIRMADVLLLNKTDALREVAPVEQEVRQINPFAAIKKTVYCNEEVEPGKAALPKYYPVSAEPMGRPEIHSMVIKSGRKTTREQVMAFLQHWAPLAYRIKGYINLKNGTTLAVQCVYGSIDCDVIAGSFFGSEIIALSDRFTLREWSQSFKAIT